MLVFTSNAETYDSIATLIKNIDYSKIDANVKTIKTVDEFLKKSKFYTTDEDKSRACYIFVMSYLKYKTDSNDFLNKKILFESVNKHKNIKDVEYKVRSEFVIKHKFGVCIDYAIFYKYLCAQLGLECVVVEGFVKEYNYFLKKSELGPHAWNIVYINGNKILVDVTFDDVYNFDCRWYSVKPSIFIESHIPDDIINFEFNCLEDYSVNINGITIQANGMFTDKVYEYYKLNEKQINVNNLRYSEFQLLDKPITLENFICSKVLHYYNGKEWYRGKTSIDYVPLKTLPLNYYNLYL
jgi:hypothetical protein